MEMAAGEEMKHKEKCYFQVASEHLYPFENFKSENSIIALNQDQRGF